MFSGNSPGHSGDRREAWEGKGQLIFLRLFGWFLVCFGCWLFVDIDLGKFVK